jgi:hypothetical protein
VPDAHPERSPAGGDDGLVARRAVRVSDAERETVVDELRLHYSAGRLDMPEFEERTRSALAARTRGDLHPLLDDLPDLAPAPTPSGPPVRARTQRESSLWSSGVFRAHVYVWVVLTVFFVVIWAATRAAGADAPFWPIFPGAAIGLTVGLHGAVRKGVDLPDFSPPPDRPHR